MSKELEALHKLATVSCVVNRFKGTDEPLKVFYKEDYDIIENALKDYERRLALAKEYKDVNNVAKRLKALEIIKEKKVSVSLFITCHTAVLYEKNMELESYNHCVESENRLTQQEYDLLKEVLL